MFDVAYTTHSHTHTRKSTSARNTDKNNKHQVDEYIMPSHSILYIAAWGYDVRLGLGINWQSYGGIHLGGNIAEVMSYFCCSTDTQQMKGTSKSCHHSGANYHSCYFAKYATWWCPRIKTNKSWPRRWGDEGWVKMKQNTNEHYNYLCIRHQFQFTFNTATFMLVVSTLPACFTNWFLALWTVNNLFSLEKLHFSSSWNIERRKLPSVLTVVHHPAICNNLWNNSITLRTSVGGYTSSLDNTNVGVVGVEELEKTGLFRWNAKLNHLTFMRKATHVFSLLLSSKIAEDVVQSQSLHHVISVSPVRAFKTTYI